MFFIAVKAPAHRIGEVSHYLYDGQRIVTAPVETEFGALAVIVELEEGTSEYRATYLADRFASGMIVAQVFNSKDEAASYIEREWL
jgi:hypothetical protein